MINVGVIGAGYWGPNLIRNFNAHNDCSVVAVADAKSDRRDFIKANYPGIEVVSDGVSVVDDSRVDAVVIATPVGLHFEIARRALQQGKHVLLEKPMTASAAEASELIELASQKDRCLMVDHTFLYTGAVRKINTLVKAGEMGDILYFDSVRVNLGLYQHDVNVLWDLAPHDVSIMDSIMKDTVVGVSAIGRRHFSQTLEDMAYMTVLFDTSAIAHFHVNWIAPAKVRTTLIGGTKKMVVYDDMQASEKVKVYDKGVEIVTDDEARRQVLVEYRVGDMTAPKIETTEALRLMSREFLDSINENRTPLTDGEAGYRIVRILEAANQSMVQNGTLVKVD